MTEQEWLDCNDPKLMCQHLELLRDVIIDEVESMQDNSRVWHRTAGNAVLGLWSARHDRYPLIFAVDIGLGALSACEQNKDIWNFREIPKICQTIREIFGNPFRPVTYEPRWKTADVLGIARMIYKERAFDRMLILADALMEAGCDNEEILAHCRSKGEHVRGCWVVELILRYQAQPVAVAEPRLT